MKNLKHSKNTICFTDKSTIRYTSFKNFNNSSRIRFIFIQALTRGVNITSGGRFLCLNHSCWKCTVGWLPIGCKAKFVLRLVFFQSCKVTSYLLMFLLAWLVIGIDQKGDNTRSAVVIIIPIHFMVQEKIHEVADHFETLSKSFQINYFNFQRENKVDVKHSCFLAIFLLASNMTLTLSWWLHKHFQ